MECHTFDPLRVQQSVLSRRCMNAKRAIGWGSVADAPHDWGDMAWLTKAERRFAERSEALQTGTVSLSCSEQVAIAIAADDLWTLLDNPEMAHALTDDVVFATHIAGSPKDALGERRVTVRKLENGLLTGIVTELIAYEPTRSVSWKSLSHQHPLVTTIEILPVGDDRCVLRESCEFTVEASQRTRLEAGLRRDLLRYVSRAKDIAEAI